MKNKMIPPPRQITKKKPPPPQVVFTAVEQEIQGTVSIDSPETERPEKVVEPKDEIKIEVPADKIESVQIEEKSEEVPAQATAPQQVVESVIVVPAIVKKPPAPMKAPTKKPIRTPPPIGRPPIIPTKVEQPTPPSAVETVEQTAEQKTQTTRQPTPVETKLEQKEVVVVQQPIAKQEVKEEISLPEPTLRVEPEIARVVPRPPVAVTKKATKKPGPPPRMAAMPLVAKVVGPESKSEEIPVDSPPRQLPSKIQPPSVEKKEEERAESLQIVQSQKQQERVAPAPAIPNQLNVVPTPSRNTHIKSEILPTSQPVPKPNASVIQVPAAKSKMAEKLEQLRRAKEKMLSDDPSLDDEDENSQLSESGLNQSDEIPEQKYEEERKEAVVAETKSAKQQVVAKEEAPAQVVAPVFVPRMAPPPVRAPLPKAPVRQPPSFPQKPISTPKPKQEVAEIEPEAKVQEKETKEEDKVNEEPKGQQKAEMQAEPAPIASAFPAEPIALQQTKPQFSLKVSIQQPKDSIQTATLLQRYHGLKSTYLSNLRQLEELIHFQRQQEDAQVDKINKLLSDLHKKNEAIKQICSAREEPIKDGPVAV